MAKVYLYGIINSIEVDNITASGVTNSKPYFIPFRDIGIIASEYAGEDIGIDYENLLKHDEVIYELMKKYCVLPVAFKTILENESDMNDFITKNYEQIKLNLEKLLNKCEMGLKVIWDVDKAKQDISSDNENLQSSYFNADTPAKKYLQQKLIYYDYKNKLEKKAELIKEKLIKELEDVCCMNKIKLLQSEKMVVNGAFLIDIAVKEKFIDSVEKLKENNKDLSFLLSGPWAPYNFIELRRD